MRHIFLFILPLGLIACNQTTDKTQILQNRIDSLESKLEDSYKPGLGEFMTGIQVHHNKLWFAGQKKNWKLAEFELHEIEEALDDIEKYQSERKESKMIEMLNAPIDSVNIAIEQNDPALFRNSYTLLTNTCNACHRAANFEFNVVKIPDSPPFSNQDFEFHSK